MSYQWMIELVEECKTQSEAEEILLGLSLQDGFVCGRVLERGGGKPWRAQAFFPDVDHPEEAAHLPNGMRRRMVPKSILQQCSNKSHSRDSDCAGHVDRETGECSVCHVLHGDPCPSCGGRAYHVGSCPKIND